MIAILEMIFFAALILAGTIGLLFVIPEVFFGLAIAVASVFYWDNVKKIVKEVRDKIKS